VRSNGQYLPQDENNIYMLGESYEIQGEMFTPAEDYTYIEEGYAGWFEYDKNHPVTQNGETYKKEVFSGMHRTLPLPSLVKVTNLENNEAVIVRINERGPMVKNRIIDVSKEAADVLKLNKDGSTKVLVEIMAIESQNLKQELLQKEAKDAMSNSKIKKDFLYRRIVAKLRDDGVLIASSSHGYEIPTCTKDILTYIEQTDTIVSPMLSRIGKCRTLIKKETDGKLDILDDKQFWGYKRYFGDL
jgi:rare lipoprotein A